MISVFKPVCFVLCAVALVRSAGAQAPTLSILRVTPATLEFSWPSNFTAANWQLMSATSLSAGSWQPVPQTPFASNGAVVVFYPITNAGSYFRLQQTIGSGCIFQATPPVINVGGSSTLTWCPEAGVTYYISPGSMAVPGGSLVVNPPSTTIYTLTASNATSVTTTNVTVIVNPCGWLQISNFEATLTFSYALAPANADFNYNVNHQANVTFQLMQQVGGTPTDAYFFGFATGGTASINDLEVNHSGPITFTTTEVGSGLPMLNVSYLSLHLTCTEYDFSYSVVLPTVETSEFGTTTSSDGAGYGVMAARPLSLVADEISDSAQVPAEYPPGTPDYFVPDSDLGKHMFNNGVVNNSTAGNASVGWTFTPEPF
jgi:hypothetical protein